MRRKQHVHRRLISKYHVYKCHEDHSQKGEQYLSKMGNNVNGSLHKIHTGFTYIM